MGFNLTWFAIQDVDAETFLERAGYADTGEPDEYYEADTSGGEMPDGWYVMVTDQMALVDPAKLAKLSVGGRLIVCGVYEGPMNSIAMEWREGKQVWCVFWDGGAEEKQLQVEGKLPDSFEAIHADVTALQAEIDKDGGGTDVVFELPLDLAEEITGFRHDQAGFDEDIPVFNVLEPIHFVEDRDE